MSSDFLKENIKKKPINKSKIGKKIIVTIISAIIFGIVASLVILVLEPFLARKINKTATEKPSLIVLPEDEKTPEELLSEYMMQENSMSVNGEEMKSPVELPLTDEQISEILSKVELDASSYKQMATSIAVYARQMGKYIVTINSSSSTIDLLKTTNNSVNTSSGLIIAKNNKELLILADSTYIKVNGETFITFSNNVSASAVIKGRDNNTTYTVLAVNLADLPENMNVDDYIPSLGNSNAIYVGMPVIAMGSPRGVAGSIGYGIIDTPKQVVPQIDAMVNAVQTNIEGSNNPSGVIFNFQGSVVGIITAAEKTSGNNIVFYGITELKNRIEKMSNEVSINYLGITAIDVPSYVNSSQGVPFGAYVTDIKMDSPAMRAGMQNGDVIVSVDEKNISNYSEYIYELNQKKVGDSVRLTINRKAVNGYKEMEFEMIVEGR